MDGMQPEVSWEVCWPSDFGEDGMTRVQRRLEQRAKELAVNAKNLGLDAKLYRVEKTEIDF